MAGTWSSAARLRLSAICAALRSRCSRTCTRATLSSTPLSRSRCRNRIYHAPAICILICSLHRTAAAFCRRRTPYQLHMQLQKRRDHLTRQSKLDLLVTEALRRELRCEARLFGRVVLCLDALRALVLPARLRHSKSSEGLQLTYTVSWILWWYSGALRPPWHPRFGTNNESLANHDSSKPCGFGEVYGGLASDCLVCLVCGRDEAPSPSCALVLPARPRYGEKCEGLACYLQEGMFIA